MEKTIGCIITSQPHYHFFVSLILINKTVIRMQGRVGEEGRQGGREGGYLLILDCLCLNSFQFLLSESLPIISTIWWIISSISININLCTSEQYRYQESFTEPGRSHKKQNSGIITPHGRESTGEEGGGGRGGGGAPREWCNYFLHFITNTRASPVLWLHSTVCTYTDMCWSWSCLR